MYVNYYDCIFEIHKIFRYDVEQIGKILNPPKGTVRIDVTGCGSAALELYSDHNFTGDTVCFIGQGFANMTDYCRPLPIGCLQNWNDYASSFSTGCSPVTFYTDKNGNGSAVDIPTPSVKGNFPFGGIPDQQLSSLQLKINCQ